MKKATYTIVFGNGDFKNFRTAEAVREWKCKENTWKQISKKGGIHTILLDDGSENIKNVYYEFFPMPKHMQDALREASEKNYAI